MTLSTPPSISVSRRGAVSGDVERAVVWVRGAHDLSTRVSLTASIARAALLDDADVLVDLSAVTFMDASTVGAIVGSANRLRSRSHSLAVRAPSPLALRVLDLCGLAHLVHRPGERAVHPSGVASALATWVEVPPSDPRPRRDRTDAATTARQDVRQPVRSMLATTDAEVDRGGP